MTRPEITIGDEPSEEEILQMYLNASESGYAGNIVRPHQGLPYFPQSVRLALEALDEADRRDAATPQPPSDGRE